MTPKPLILLVQLPIPPFGQEPVEGNVPLAGAYLKLFADRQGLGEVFDIEIWPAILANRLGDQAAVEAILERRPMLVGFSCYLWNIERSLWIARQLKSRRPELLILLGGPEITADNAWVLQNPAVDYAILGEGEQPFAKLLASLARSERTDRRPQIVNRVGLPNLDLDAFASPYTAGIVRSAVAGCADQQRMSLETARGCRYRCKYCYYPKSHDTLRFLSSDQILTNLQYAVEYDMTEVVLLDPTLNQRPHFAEFLELLRRGNPSGRMAFSGELRAEGIDADTARLLRQANFQEVEIGLQSVEPAAWRLMGRPTNLQAFEQGVHAMLAEGIRMQVDLILGLPGDTVDSVRRGIDFLQRTKAYSQAAVFNLSILPGTAFRRDAESLGLKYQPWPPYYVTQTPTLDVENLFALMEEAQEAFGVEFDAIAPPRLDQLDARCVCRIDLDDDNDSLPDTNSENSRGLTTPGSVVHLPTLSYTLWFRSADFDRHRDEAVRRIERLLAENPHTTLSVVLEPTGDPSRLSSETLQTFLSACYRTTTYLDRYYSLHPGALLGAKRLIVLLSPRQRACRDWRRRTAEFAAIVKRSE
jgi:radical SAM superfamily enzyme YgiQ (UPF0313 family)